MKPEYMTVYLEAGSVIKDDNGNYSGYITVFPPYDKSKIYYSYKLKLPQDEILNIIEKGLVEHERNANT